MIYEIIWAMNSTSIHVRFPETPLTMDACAFWGGEVGSEATCTGHRFPIPKMMLILGQTRAPQVYPKTLDREVSANILGFYYLDLGSPSKTTMVPWFQLDGHGSAGTLSQLLEDQPLRARCPRHLELRGSRWLHGNPPAGTIWNPKMNRSVLPNLSKPGFCLEMFGVFNCLILEGRNYQTCQDASSIVTNVYSYLLEFMGSIFEPIKGPLKKVECIVEWWRVNSLSKMVTKTHPQHEMIDEHFFHKSPSMGASNPGMVSHVNFSWIFPNWMTIACFLW